MENTIFRSTLNNYTKIMKRAKITETYWLNFKITETYWLIFKITETYWLIFKTSETAYWIFFISTGVYWITLKTLIKNWNYYYVFKPQLIHYRMGGSVNFSLVNNHMVN